MFKPAAITIAGKKRKLEGIDHTMSQKDMKRARFLTDRRLIPRIKQYLGENKDLKYVDMTDLTVQLQNLYPEYGRKKRNVFKVSVCQAFEIINQEKEDSLSHLEAEHVKKRKKENTKNKSNEKEEESEFSEDNLNYVAYEDRNGVNNTLTSLYGTPQKNETQSKVPLPSQKIAELESQAQSSGAEGVIKNKKKSEEKPKSKKKEIVVQESTLSFCDVGGNEKCLEEVCKLMAHMSHPEIDQRLGVTPPRGFLLHGPPGCGKTLLAHAIAGELKLPFIKVAATEIVSGVSGESEEKIRDLFDKAVSSAPCILFIDEIDAITPKRETAQREMERRIVSQLLTCMDDMNQKAAAAQVFVIGATNRPDSLDPALRRAGRFDREISMGIPDQKARSSILKVLCRNLKLKTDFDYEALSLNTPGYVGADLMALAREAAMHAFNRIFHSLPHNMVDESQGNLQKLLSWFQQPPLADSELDGLFIEMDDFQGALKVVQPSALREGFSTIPNVTWNDVGALHDVREELKMKILGPVKHAKQFETFGLTSSSGVLLCGPPGCGKTLLAKAIANESGINFISVKGPELLNMYVGESERAVRQCFQRARNSAPCVIFFDELDALCPRRSDSSDSGSSVRVVNQLLTEMDGLESRKQVFIMGATNRPDIIDPAMLRPGRLDKVLYVGLPNKNERCDILKTITKNGTKPPLSSDVDIEALAFDCRTDGYTGADLTALVREASEHAIKKLLSQSSPENQPHHVSLADFEAAFSKVRPSVSSKDRRFYELMRHKTTSKNAKSKSNIAVVERKKDDEPNIIKTEERSQDVQMEELKQEMVVQQPSNKQAAPAAPTISLLTNFIKTSVEFYKNLLSTVENDAERS